jgi:hypothetical protein
LNKYNMREINKISDALFEKIRDRFDDVSLGDENAKATSNPEDARFFNFDYTVDGVSHGNITISVIDETSLKVYFSKNISSDLDEEQRAKWYGFLRELREFAKRNLLSFEPRDITRSTLKHRDLQQVSKSDSTYSKDEVIGEGIVKSGGNGAKVKWAITLKNGKKKTVNAATRNGVKDFLTPEELIIGYSAVKQPTVDESRLHGTSRSSYEQDGNVKIIVRHSDRVDPEQRGARSRKIKALFVETTDGERFKLPYNNLKYARAMARHVSEGGSVNDDFGQHITKVAEECGKLRPFKSQMVRRTFEDQETQAMVEAAFEYHGLLNDTLKRMSGRKGYAACKESFQMDEQTLMDDFDVDSMRERFVRKTYNDATDTALPIVQKAYNMKKSNKFAQQFESWATNVAEGTWATPEGEEQVSELIDLLMEPLPVGVDAINATNALYNLIGDDVLFDRLGDLADENSEADARDVVMDWVQENMPEIYGKVMAAIGDEDPADQTVGESEMEFDRDQDEPDQEYGSDLEFDQDRDNPDQFNREMGEGEYDEDQVESIQTAIVRRILNNINQHSELLKKAGPDGVMNAARDVASFHAPVEELGSSDISAMVREVYNEVGVEYPEMNEGIVDTIRGMNYKRLADRSFNKAMNAQDDTMKYGLADRRRGKHEKEFNKQMDKMRQRTDKAKSLGIDESKMSDMDIDISDLTDQEFLEKYNHTKQQAIDGDWENHYEPETMPEPTDESIGDDAMTPQQKNIKMKRMGAKPLSFKDKLKTIPHGIKAIAKDEPEDDVSLYNKQFNEELAQMRKIAGL